EERITAILPIPKNMEGQYIFMATSNGTVKKVDMNAFSRPRSNGLIAIDLDDDNELVNVAVTNGAQDILLVANSGKVIRFDEQEVRALGRTARGVRGMRLQDGQRVIMLLVPEEGGQVLTASKNGYGKRTPVEDFPRKGRGTQGVIGMVVNDRNGELVGASQVFGGEDIMLISNQGTLVRTRVDEVSLLSRNTQGVTLIKLGNEEHLVGVERIPELEGAEDDIDEDDDGSSSEVGNSVENENSAENGNSDETENP
ncbi:MAG: DNA gyrase subunit A, partial [Gammaproteobacteria bacterium HGW-Gammaproteobacteria-14]